jgi:hypothetical protein
MPTATRCIAAGLEVLEARIAPAAVFSYLEADGDMVTIKTSTGTSPHLETAAAVVGGQLEKLDLSMATWGTEFAGATVTFSVTKGAAGDGQAQVGYLNATGIDLGSVTIKGDLGQIDAGDSTTATPAITSLTAASMGRFGLDTQGVGGSQVCDIKGALTKLTVAGDVTDVLIDITGGADGKLGALVIGGSLVGGTSNLTGQISTDGDIGAVQIKGDIHGGTGNNAGGITSGGKIASVTIGGSLLGGWTSTAGVIFSAGALGPVKITGDVFHGRIVGSSSIASVTIGGSVVGGSVGASGEIEAATDIGPVTIGRDLAGGSGSLSGLIFSGNGAIASVTIGGSMLGGSNSGSGKIEAETKIGPLKIGHDFIGGSGTGSAVITSNTGNIEGITIGGSLLGGTVDDSGKIFARTEIGLVKIGGSLAGGAGVRTGVIQSATGGIAGVMIGGSLIGGASTNAGLVIAQLGSGRGEDWRRSAGQRWRCYRPAEH